MGLMLTKNQRLGFIMGSHKINIEELDTFVEYEVTTEFGSVFMKKGKDSKILILPRHGKNSNIPPHKINHRANMMAFQNSGVNTIISFTSVGSLKLELEPSSMILPDDYININSIQTYFDNKIRHILPGLDDTLREQVFAEIKQLPIKIRFNGIYIQTQGPRLETKAEIQMLKNFGDIIGMTMAVEATLAKELELSYANISVIDNYCNGLIEEPLTMEAIQKNQVKSNENIKRIIQRILPIDLTKH